MNRFFKFFFQKVAKSRATLRNLIFLLQCVKCLWNKLLKSKICLYWRQMWKILWLRNERQKLKHFQTWLNQYISWKNFKFDVFALFIMLNFWLINFFEFDRCENNDHFWCKIHEFLRVIFSFFIRFDVDKIFDVMRVKMIKCMIFRK